MHEIERQRKTVTFFRWTENKFSSILTRLEQGRLEQSKSNFYLFYPNRKNPKLIQNERMPFHPCRSSRCPNGQLLLGALLPGTWSPTRWYHAFWKGNFTAYFHSSQCDIILSKGSVVVFKRYFFKFYIIPVGNSIDGNVFYPMAKFSLKK